MGRNVLALADDRDPWEQQPDETKRMYARFAIYRDLGEYRTLDAALEIINTTGKKIDKATLRQVCYLYRWSERCHAYDDQQTRAERSRLIALRRDMLERHRKIASGFLAKAVETLRQLDADGLSPADVVRFVQTAADLERKALGEPTERVALTGPSGASPVQIEDLSGLTPEQRRIRLAQVAAELARRAAVPESEEG